MSAIYLDHCSTTPLHPAVAQAMWECQQSCLGNPASPHQFGQAAKRVLEGIREALARQLGADVAEVGGEQLVFTSGGTESNNLALRGLAGHPPGRILVSAVEHPSVSAPADELARQGFDVRRIPVDSKGLLRLDQLDELLDSSTRLVSVQFGNHETGVVQPLDEIVARCRRTTFPYIPMPCRPSEKCRFIFVAWDWPHSPSTPTKSMVPSESAACYCGRGSSLGPFYGVARSSLAYDRDRNP